MRLANLLKGVIFASAFYASLAHSAFDTSFLVSSEMGNRLAAEEFPITLELEPERLFVTQPILIFLDPKRLGFRVRFQAYDHRPASTVAISETGDAQFSGELDFDPVTQRILLHNPKLDRLEFDRDNLEARRLSQKIKEAWREQVSNPLRADIPPHPYIAPFKDNIRNISYDGENIKLHISYD
jgi:hypothetical protein